MECQSIFFGGKKKKEKRRNKKKKKFKMSSAEIFSSMLSVEMLKFHQVNGD